MTALNASDNWIEDPIWQPAEDKKHLTNLWVFKRMVADKTGRDFQNYADFHQWSIDNPAEFWSEVWDLCDIIGEKGDAPFLIDGDKMPGAQFFPKARLNYAENMLRRHDESPAIIFRAEGHETDRVMSWRELYDQVSHFQQALIELGLKKGDRICGLMPNMPETIVACLAAASLGIIWSSASPDFGVKGVLDRFGQIEPKLMITVEGYFYNGKVIDCMAKNKEIAAALPSLEKIVLVPFVRDDQKPSNICKRALSYKAFLDGFDTHPIKFERVEFNHPLFIMFSSGTTGVPKCIVHGHGGTILQHVKEHRLQCDIKHGDRIFYFTTTGWMMWNWLISGLMCEATLMLYDGSPFYPDGNALWDYADKHDCVLFGTSAKYIDALKKAGYEPRKTHDLSSIHMLCSTGSPLVAESFDYIHEAIKNDIHVASISGGTDIVSCFVLGNPISPVWRGEIQGPGLGMAVEVWDDDGKAVCQGQGELVCTKPFPSMPVKFWNDPDNARYKSAYFERFDNVWCHGDWVEKTPHGGIIIHGRSDATLNPQGVRIGTAEIYRQVEQLEEVLESIAIGQQWEDDVRVVLFVILRDGVDLDEGLTKTIKTQIRTGASPRHVPAKIVQVTDIPRTKSGKITELAVKHTVHGRTVKNTEALANPDALEQYKNRPELAS